MQVRQQEAGLLRGWGGKGMSNRCDLSNFRNVKIGLHYVLAQVGRSIRLGQI